MVRWSTLIRSDDAKTCKAMVMNILVMVGMTTMMMMVLRGDQQRMLLICSLLLLMKVALLLLARGMVSVVFKYTL